MEINWEAEIQKHSEDLMADLTELLKIDSARDVEHKTDEFPLGPGPAKALLKALSFMERDGFETVNVENVAGRAEYGSGDEIVGILGHMDVVPAGEGWKTNPFEPVIKDGKIYARGSSDDKGPAMAAYYALKTIKDLNLPLSKKVHFILGTDEESEWYGMERYLKSQPSPDIAFSPDAEFPIINGEKGIVSYEIKFDSPATNDNATFTLNRLESGLRTNMVPQSAHAIITSENEEDYKQLESLYREFLGKHKLEGDINKGEMTLTGNGAHAQEPKDGRNAGTFLALFLSELDLDDAGKEYVDVIARYFHEDSRGNLLNINTVDEVMGELTASPDIFFYETYGDKNIVLNVRYPQNITAEEINDRINDTLGKSFDNITSSIMGEPEVPHYVPGSDPLVKTLLSVYEHQTGQKGHEQVIGGGTYGRMFKRGVAFGALFPGEENVMHQPNEYINIDTIMRAAAIYAEAIYELAK